MNKYIKYDYIKKKHRMVPIYLQIQERERRWNGPIPLTNSSLTGPSYEQKVYISSFLQIKEKFQQDVEFGVDFNSAYEAWKGYFTYLGGGGGVERNEADGEPYCQFDGQVKVESHFKSMIRSASSKGSGL